jgi:hypothetical protein
MADPVYDEDREKHLDSLSPEAIGRLEDLHSSKQDEKEDKAAEAGGDTSKMSGKGMGRALRQRSEKKDAKAAEDLNKGVRDEWQAAKSADAAAGVGLYKAGAGKSGRLSSLKQKKALVVGIGVALSILIAGLVFLFGFLNIFKLDSMMSNIDLKAFSRFNSATSGRSDKWIQSYFSLRLTQIRGVSGADPESEYFRANKVDTNNPIRDWYQTMRTSSFEADLAKQGIAFVNRDAGGGVKFSVLYVDGVQVAGLTAADVRSGNLVTELRTNPNFVKSRLEIDLTNPGGSKKARTNIKQVVNDLSREDSVLKRRQIRKAIQNMTGVKDWKFFETTRDKISSITTDIRNKIITAAIPEDTKTGKFVRCFFGITNCKPSDDPVNPQNDDAAILAGDTPKNVSSSDPVKSTDAKGNTVTDKTTVVDYSNSADVLKSIIGNISGVVNGLNLISTLDLLARVDKALSSGELSKGVAVAKGIQAMGLYQVFETARDQMKTGDLTGAEVNQFMQVIGPVASSEGWTKVLDGQGNPGQVTNDTASQVYCSPKNQVNLANNPQKADSQFAYLCPDKQIGGTSNAKTIENNYKSGIGQVISPIVSAYEKIRKLPIIGRIISLGERVIGAITGKVVSTLTSILGLNGTLQDALKYMVTQIASFLGAGPIMTGNEGGGVYMNWLVQGGAYTAEAASRTNGAAATTPASSAAAQSALAYYTKTQQASKSVFDRYLSLSNPTSLASNAMVSVSQLKLSSLAGMLNPAEIAKKTTSAFAMMFGRSASAASINGYAAANFAGIQTYDYPQQCYNLDPLTEKPQDGTNIQQVLSQHGVQIPVADLTWDLVTDSTKWYSYIYAKIATSNAADNPDPVTEQIYNCNLLDNAVRGGLGYVYGYTKDNGLQ